ncbi:MAG: glycosyltransferase family 4 protein [Fluviicola sp.]|jgi:glycosyltransferase involved in cell wall biosynthesis|uniref:glycosyltransferase family 4 protein n=1 Tax=Fluviicola sp. TaxID=1917219 RepID=UPI00262E594C|nr:glycosyltransferase family 4 protein [Fluviicola sp.]MDF3028624.1 glycosyltransferase family 4 protein [Fluviicola sp.]
MGSRLLILTQYYPPEIGAPQNRLHELAVRLKAKGMHVEVLTAMPNYPKMQIHEEYKNGKILEEVIDGIPVHRSKIYVSDSKGIIKRLLNYFSFVYTSCRRGKKLENFDFLMVESPPLFLGYSAMRLSRKLNAKLIFNVSDLWPESAEKLGLVTNKFLLGLAYRLEAKCYRRSYLITGQTQGIVDDISKRFPEKKVVWLPNGVDLSFYNPAEIEKIGYRERNGLKESDILFFYGGVVGYAQGLDVILNAAKLLENRPEIQFIIQGAGPEKERLLQLKEELKVTNVHFLPPVEKSEMPGVLKEINVAVIPLRKLDLFEGAIPSKVFETLAMEVPILLGVNGEARLHFVDKAQAAIFVEPENASVLAENVLLLADNPELATEMGKNGRKYAEFQFNRDVIASNFLKTLNA